ncbi:NAD(P)-binding protein [Hyaloscypha variabilis F]|uniref:NAD(P)-binding protein n=1 Tax=Hyaloscypha variabilis (strain UAMH 11265 / GT02V1 / F) TaxID=1149755 RepID=A0A2J6RP70_HYAVF|nr:NAD(P)-binding protein [Hyaloscypha variabilis F]
MDISYVLVTGATGFIGAHVVDVLLHRGLKVRGATRSKKKAQAMLDARPNHSTKLDFVQIQDFERTGVFDGAVKDVDAVIHVASPFTYDTKDNEKELIIPAINGVRSILSAAASPNSKVKRVVVTSSFAAVLDINRKTPPFFTYTSADWNPLTYAEATAPETNSVVAYRGSKKFAELEVWNYLQSEKPKFDVVTLCPPMTFGPVVHPVDKVEDLNESNAQLWKIATGATPLPVTRVPFWIDVRDLADAHAQALLRPEAGNKRYTPASPEHFSYALAANIMLEEFSWAKGKISEEEQAIDKSYGLDGETVTRELGVKYRSFKETVVDLVSQAWDMEKQSDV